jgi:hypothetical protein
MVYEWWIGKDLEGTERRLIGILSWHFPGGAEENCSDLDRDSQCPSQDAKWAPTEDKSGVLPLR